MGFFQGRYVKGWVSDPAGNSAGGWGLTLTPRDMARFGYLYLNHGLWGQTRIVPETWVGESTAMTPNNYGYLWWLFGGGYAAMGDGGNIIFCSPEKDVVIAATASLSPDSHSRTIPYTRTGQIKLTQSFICPVSLHNDTHLQIRQIS